MITQEVTQFRKNEDTLFQPPSCKLERKNGIKLHSWIQSNIPPSALHPNYLIDWMAAQATIKFTLSGDEKHLGVHAIQDDDASFDVSYKSSEEISSYPIDIERVSGFEQILEPILQ